MYVHVTYKEAVIPPTLINTYFSSEISVFNSWCIFCIDFKYIFSFSLAWQVFEIQKTHNLHKFDADILQNIFSALNNILSVDKLQ